MVPPARPTGPRPAAAAPSRPIRRREGVSRAEAVTDDMTFGYPVSLAQLALWTSFPREPYSAVPPPSNWQLWRNSPPAAQRSRRLAVNDRFHGPQLSELP